MLKLKRWQWIVLALPPIALLLGLFILAGRQLHAWRLDWVWGIVAIAIVAWRWLLSQWTKPHAPALEQNLADVRSQRQWSHHKRKKQS